MSVADDYGRFYASPATVRGACWPTRPGKVREQDVSKWLTECAQGESPLLRLYDVSGCRFLEITGFGQQIRSKSKFPEYDINLLSTCEQNSSTSRSRISESESKTKAVVSSANANAVAAALDYEESWAEEAWPSVRRFIAKYNRESPDAWPAVERLDDKRVAKVREYLGHFPDEEFWTTVYRNAKRSRWCLEYKGAGMDWLLQVGKDGVRNCLKTYEGKYGEKSKQSGARD